MRDANNKMYLCRGLAKANCIFGVGGVGVVIHLHPFLMAKCRAKRVGVVVISYPLATQ